MFSYFLGNVYIITGTPKDNSDSTNFIETPYFPTPYVPGYRAEYILRSDDPDGHVLLLFLDFQISLYSFIEVSLFLRNLYIHINHNIIFKNLTWYVRHTSNRSVFSGRLSV